MSDILNKDCIHLPVMAEEVLSFIDIKKTKIFLDGTFGFGGYASVLLKKNPGVKIYGFDIDEEVFKIARKKFLSNKNVILFNESYKKILKTLPRGDIGKIDAAVIDLGICSYHLDCERGFSFKKNAPLDMRFSKKILRTAEDILNTADKEDLIRIFTGYGEEKYGNSRRLAENIINKRGDEFNTKDFADLIIKTFGKNYSIKTNAKARIFQSIRIEVNGELSGLGEALEDFIEVLKPGGVLIVLSYHSLEDRIVKKTFNYLTKDCLCPKEIIYCRCGHKRKAEKLTKKPLRPSGAETRENPKSKSAKLRCVKKTL